MKKKMIGKVKLTYLQRHTGKKYQDSAESFLLKFFKSLPESKKTTEIEKILNNKPGWDIYYNLIPQRKHILDWYPFNKNSSLLEIGAGTGAVTGMLTEKVKKVTALELTEARAEILAHRLQDKENLQVFSGNIQNFEPKEKYDYIVMIGVLEYAGLFSQNNKTTFDEAYQYTLNKAHSFLNKFGTLFVAIENPIGLRYFSGAVEDHYGELFEGIENYTQYNGIRTYTKKELVKIILKSGFKKTDVYLACPDYKLPQQIIHEDYINNFDQISLSALWRNIDVAHPLFHFFSEIMLAAQLKKEKILTSFGNSFLIVAKK